MVYWVKRTCTERDQHFALFMTHQKQSNNRLNYITPVLFVSSHAGDTIQLLHLYFYMHLEKYDMCLGQV